MPAQMTDTAGVQMRTGLRKHGRQLPLLGGMLQQGVQAGRSRYASPALTRTRWCAPLATLPARRGSPQAGKPGERCWSGSSWYRRGCPLLCTARVLPQGPRLQPSHMHTTSWTGKKSCHKKHAGYCRMSVPWLIMTSLTVAARGRLIWIGVASESMIVLTYKVCVHSFSN